MRSITVILVPIAQIQRQELTIPRSNDCTNFSNWTNDVFSGDRNTQTNRCDSATEASFFGVGCSNVVIGNDNTQNNDL